MNQKTKMKVNPISSFANNRNQIGFHFPEEKKTFPNPNIFCYNDFGEEAKYHHLYDFNDWSIS